MTNFQKAFKIIVGVEGGYVDNKNDPGGETKYGISKRSYPDEDIKELTLERAKEIYKNDFWIKLNCDSMAWPLNLIVFDSAVQHGQTIAIKLLQRALKIKEDGIYGRNTLAAVEARDPYEVAKLLLTVRVFYYQKLATFQIYGRGWMNRLFEVALSA